MRVVGRDGGVYTICRGISGLRHRELRQTGEAGAMADEPGLTRIVGQGSRGSQPAQQSIHRFEVLTFRKDSGLRSQGREPEFRAPGQAGDDEAEDDESDEQFQQGEPGLAAHRYVGHVTELNRALSSWILRPRPLSVQEIDTETR